MNQQPSTSRSSVALAGVLVVLALAAFGAAFYLFDGAGIVLDAYETAVAALSPQPTPAPQAPPKSQEATLVLPAGMPPEFALRLWQEQVDSQDMIARLRDGDVASLKVISVQKSGDEAKLNVVVTLKDGSSAPGVIGFRRFGDQYFVAYATSDRGRLAGAPESDLPAIEDVDLELLSTILAEQVKSQANIAEYLGGQVKQVNVEAVKPGPNTATVEVEMDEDHEEGYADLVLIKSGGPDEELWFLAKFLKTGSEPLKQ